MEKVQKGLNDLLFPFVIITTSIALYLTTLHENYLLFHSLAEVFSIVVYLSIFMVAWNSRQYVGHKFLLIIGLGLLFIGLLDMLHTMTYKGMPIFPEGGSDLPTQIWIAARYMEAAAFLTALVLLCDDHRKECKISAKRAYGVFLAYLVVFILLVLSIFYWKNFPVCYRNGVGLTAFKKSSEYVISALFLVSLIILFRKKKVLDKDVFGLLSVFLVVKIATELMFTEYVSVYGFSNALGHVLKYISSLLLYRAVVEFSLMKPYAFLFLGLKKSEEALRKSEERYRAVVEDQTEFVRRILPDGEITFVNKAYCRFFHRSPKELIGKKVMPLVFSGDLEKMKAALFHLSVDKPMSDVEYRVISANGHLHWTHWTNRAIFDSQGKITEIQSVGRDIHSRKLTEEKLMKTQEELRKRVENQLMESYKHLGLINRKISLLLEMEKQNEKDKNKQRIADYVLTSALNLSKAKVGLIYTLGAKNEFHLISGNDNDSKLQVIPLYQVKFKERLIGERARISGPRELVDPGCFDRQHNLSYFIALPLVKERDCRGILFLGFTDIKSMESQELEFFDVFAKHASTALSNAGMLK